MNPITAGILGSGLLIFLLFLGMPIAFVMMFVGFLGITYLTSINAALPVVAKTVYETAAHYPYTIIPLFILMGGFAGNAGITRELYETFDKWFITQCTEQTSLSYFAFANEDEFGFVDFDHWTCPQVEFDGVEALFVGFGEFGVEGVIFEIKCF